VATTDDMSHTVDGLMSALHSADDYGWSMELDETMDGLNIQ